MPLPPRLVALRDRHPRLLAFVGAFVPLALRLEQAWRFGLLVWRWLFG